MKYPILVSPSSRPDIILEFTNTKTARIIHATDAPQIKNSGYTSGIGYKSTCWTSLESFSPTPATKGKYIRESWAYPSLEIMATNPYICYHYPELFI